MLHKGVVVVEPSNPPNTTCVGVAATHRIANRSIMCHVLDELAAAGIDEIAVVVPAGDMDEIAACISDDGAFGSAGVQLIMNARGDLLGALRAAAPFVGDEACVVHTADGLVGQELAPLIEAAESDESDLILLLHRTAEKRDRLDPATQRLLGISELNSTRTCLSLVGVVLFGPSALHHACALATDARAESDLTAVAEHLAAGGSVLRAQFVRTWRRYCGDPVDLLELNRIVLDQQAPDGEPFDGVDNRIEGRVVIHPTAEVASSIILGPTIIGPSARISNSYIGPYTSIGADTEIEGAEIERSIISDGARIKHISGRIEASTVGRRASIFRDFALPRAMRLHVGEDVELALN